MARKADIYRSPPFDAALAGGIGEADGKRSRRVGHICGRYLELLRRAELPAFSEAEWMLLRHALHGAVQEPAATIRGLWQGVEDSIKLDGLAGTWEVDGAALVERLKALTFLQEVALVEEVERWWATAPTHVAGGRPEPKP